MILPWFSENMPSALADRTGCPAAAPPGTGNIRVTMSAESLGSCLSSDCVSLYRGQRQRYTQREIKSDMSHM